MVILKQANSLFGVLFPVLFALGLAQLSIILYECLLIITRVHIPLVWKERIKSIIEGLSAAATLAGSLGTIIALVEVGLRLWAGKLNIGVHCLSLIIQGFSSTGWGISVALLGLIWNQIFNFQINIVDQGGDVTCLN